MSRQSRTELLETAVVDRAIRAPSNESNGETGPTPEIQVRRADLADPVGSTRGTGRPPGSTRRRRGGELWLPGTMERVEPR